MTFLSLRRRFHRSKWRYIPFLILLSLLLRAGLNNSPASGDPIITAHVTSGYTAAEMRQEHYDSLLIARRIIVIDPGGGGSDIGASGHGMIEKDIALHTARELRQALRAYGSSYEVYLTRNDDRTLSASQRALFTIQHDADLFISIQAAPENSPATGAAIYTAQPRMHHSGDTMAALMLNLRSRDAAGQAGMLAQYMIAGIDPVFPLRRRPHRQVESPDMPYLAEISSLRIELGQLRNPRDARLLASPDNIRNLAEALARAVNTYFNEQRQITENPPLDRNTRRAS